MDDRGDSSINGRNTKVQKDERGRQTSETLKWLFFKGQTIKRTMLRYHKIHDSLN